MPFIDSDFLLSEKETIQTLLITSADDSDVIHSSFELAKIFHQKGNTVLWVDGNLGESSPENFTNSQNLERVILGQLPITEAIQEVEGISVLTGHAKIFLAERTEIEQQQFILNLKILYPNFDKVILTVKGNNPILQKEWIDAAENVYLLFRTKNLLLGRTLNWLKENGKHTKGLIGIGKNDQEILLTYMRLKEILGNVPELILDIKKIAP